MAALRAEAEAPAVHIAARPVDPERAMAYIRSSVASWEKAQPKTRAALIQPVEAEIVFRGEEFISVRLTPEAYAHGLAVAVPQEVEVPCCRAGDGHGMMWRWRARQDSTAWMP
jgi:hypothetical protein